MAAVTYPVRVEARLDSHLSRGLWLVKWLLAFPHYVVLAFLWVAFVLSSVVAFFGILFTGRYPRGIFNFNLGVLRWSWRVHYYTFGGLGTDRYPPFTLRDVPEYSARLDIAYPEQLSRGLVLVKWWLLAIPHYIVVGVFLGGGAWFATHRAIPGGGLVALLVLFGGIALLFTGRYPRSIFDFVLGMNRWALRVAAYAGLMTDEYPPFRLDMGESEPVGTLTLPPPQSPTTPPDAPDAPEGRGGGWTAWRIVSLISGVLVSLIALGLLTGGGVAVWANESRTSGYVTSDGATFRSAGYAVTSGRVSLGDSVADAGWPGRIIGTIRLRATSANATTPIFIGIAPTDQANRYLSGVPRTTMHEFNGHDQTTVLGDKTPTVLPAAATIWVAETSGTGQQSVLWKPKSGDWTVVVMNANAAPGVDVHGDIGATFPWLKWVAVGLFAVGGVLLLLGVFLIVMPIRRAM